MSNYYEHYKNMYDSIKPIRGRSEEVRPIGRRNRDWERIEQNEDGAIACRLYHTQVVVYYPTGEVGIRCDGHETPLTAEFIYTHSPFQCYKRYKKLWLVMGLGEVDPSHYPVPVEGEIKFHFVDGKWRPVEQVTVMKRVMDRDKTKAARAPVQPFLKFAKTFLTLSDGWIMHETRKQVGGLVMDRWEAITYNYDIPDSLVLNPYYGQFDNEGMYQYICECSEDDFLGLMCYLLHHRQRKWESMRKAAIEYYGGKQMEFYDHRFTFEQLKKKVYDICNRACDVYRLEKVEITDAPIHNAV